MYQSCYRWRFSSWLPAPGYQWLKPTINIDTLPLKITSDELRGMRDRCATFIDDKGASVDATKQTNSANEAKFAFVANAEIIKNLTNDNAGWTESRPIVSTFRLVGACRLGSDPLCSVR